MLGSLTLDHPAVRIHPDLIVILYGPKLRPAFKKVPTIADIPNKPLVKLILAGTLLLMLKSR